MASELVQILGKSLRVDHVSDYKPPKDNDKYDDETRQLHSEGCAPKEQLPPSQIKREPPKEEISGGVRLPMRLPIDDVKREKEVKKEKKDRKEKERKDKKHKKEKKSKKDKKKDKKDKKYH